MRYIGRLHKNRERLNNKQLLKRFIDIMIELEINNYNKDTIDRVRENIKRMTNNK
jgi:hypothetical protein